MKTKQIKNKAFQSVLALSLISALSTACNLQMDSDGKIIAKQIQLDGDDNYLRLKDDDDHFESENENEDPDKVVCDPLGGKGGNGDFLSGIKGDITYLPEFSRKTAAVRDLRKNGIKVDVPLFMNDINVPTRPFNRGFIMANGKTIKTPKGGTMYEYFALGLKAKIKLSDDDQAGHYQFAILSDDGAILELNTNGDGLREIVDNDGLHPTRMACASKTLFMDSSSQIPMNLEYYQGPRYHIALMLLWRQVDELDKDDTDFLNDSSCGKMGNGRFFDSTKPNTPAQPEYIRMQQRGWKPLTADNFVLPDNVRQNPCKKEPIKDPGGGGGKKPCKGFSCGNGGIGV